MDIFLYNLPQHATNKSTEQWLQPILAGYGISECHCEVFRGRKAVHGNVTILNPFAGQTFLARHRSIAWGSSMVSCKAANTHESNLQMKVRALQFEVEQKAQKQAPGTTNDHTTKHKNLRNRFDVLSLDCGNWDFQNKLPVFVQNFQYPYPGMLAVGSKSSILILESHPRSRIDFLNWGTTHVIVDEKDCTVTYTLWMPPKIYRLQASEEDIIEDISGMMTRLHFSLVKPKPVQPQKKQRLLGLDPAHAKVAGLCLIYRLRLKDVQQIREFKAYVATSKKLPSSYTMHVAKGKRALTTREELEKLSKALFAEARSESLPFAVRFQVERFARATTLRPLLLINLLPKIKQLVKQHGYIAVCYALTQLKRERPDVDPYADPTQFSLDYLHQRLEHFITNYATVANDDPYKTAERHTHIVLVHRVSVTPTGLLLDGPEPEPANRVLRKYSTKQDHFLRLLFVDEDGSAVHFDPRADQDHVFERFKNVLDAGIMIGGGTFSFLGFSHSSLRAHACWAMQPIYEGGSLHYAAHIIKDLGNFDHIRIPAKCAARIGQNFTDTNSTIKLTAANVGYLPIVERNGRDFSDGCGTISQALLDKIHEVYGQHKLLKPTVLQIRFQGAKGMVSLDTRLKGELLMLRSNMVKFDAPNAWDLEVCGAGFRPLPLVLNRQLIKVLNDLGVPDSAFLRLQAQATARLTAMTGSAINTVTVLSDLLGFRSTGMLELIQSLADVGLDYHADPFLQLVVNLGVVHLLQEMKYRGRIPVADGMTLYGIMDETGYLQEGEVYIVTESAPDGGRKVHVQERILITRSPVMHPGDAQLVKAVAVPPSSPLSQLSNCVVFSQFGQRDLPSQLSGGDLDGDQYHLIFDPALIPPYAYEPAEYPRMTATELDRVVTAQDMSDFFIEFYKQDQLGMICNSHLQLADISDENTFDSSCIMLSQLASTAVDFSKTGIAVQPEDVRRYTGKHRSKPHFMAPTPRMVISELGEISLDEDFQEIEDDALDGLDVDRRPTRYYRSIKVLGQLFDAVDEQKFLANLRHVPDSQGSGMMEALLSYILRWALNYGLQYEHHLALAQNIRECFEESLIEILYHCSPSANAPVTEMEAFSGNILGRRGGVVGKPLREQSNTLRERLENIIEHTLDRVRRGDQGYHEGDLIDLGDPGDVVREAFPRAIAALVVGMRKLPRKDPKLGELVSFRYVAASVCLAEFKRYLVTTFGKLTYPQI